MSVVYLLPLSCFLIFQLTFVGTYVAAMLNDHSRHCLPYISDTAAYPPESCYFGQLINTGCVLLGLTIYVRYRQIVHVIDHHVVLKEILEKINTRSLLIGLASCYGVSIVANFQVINAKFMHYVGAFSAFGLGTVYLWFQTVISYKLESYISVRKTLLRFILAIISSIFFTMIVICGAISKIVYTGPKDNPHWDPIDNGWRYHIAATISEWIVATIFCAYILTFSEEFKYVDFDRPQILFIQKDIKKLVNIVVADNAAL